MVQRCLIAAPVFFFLEIKTFFLLVKTLCVFFHPISTVFITPWPQHYFFIDLKQKSIFLFHWKVPIFYYIMYKTHHFNLTFYFINSKSIRILNSEFTFSKLKKKKNSNFRFHFTKNLGYKRTISFTNPCTESIILFSNLVEIENCQFLVFQFLILNWISKIELIFNFLNKMKN